MATQSEMRKWLREAGIQDVNVRGSIQSHYVDFYTLHHPLKDDSNPDSPFNVIEKITFNLNDQPTNIGFDLYMADKFWQVGTESEKESVYMTDKEQYTGYAYVNQMILASLHQAAFVAFQEAADILSNIKDYGTDRMTDDAIEQMAELRKCVMVGVTYSTLLETRLKANFPEPQMSTGNIFDDIMSDGTDSMVEMNLEDFLARLKGMVDSTSSTTREETTSNEDGFKVHDPIIMNGRGGFVENLVGTDRAKIHWFVGEPLHSEEFTYYLTRTEV
jgi:hypothetical protein